MYKTEMLGLVAIILTLFVIAHLSAKVRNRYLYLMSAIGALYIFGEFSQTFLIGPRWIRWHMSDVGWISWLTIVLTYLKLSFGINELQRLKSGVWISFFTGIGIEFLQMILISSQTNPRLTARGDWVDVMIFIIMLGVNLLLLAKVKNADPAPPQQNK